ncbi:MAG: rhodanese-like domain-containing protein [Bacteroidota bacterium]
MNAQVDFYKNKLAFEMDPADLFEALNNGQKIAVIDARRPEAFEKEHIPGAINFPHRAMNADTTQSLDKTILYITYCDGIGCNASTKGALNLAKLGFTVKELIGGIDWWKRDGYATAGHQGVEAGLKPSCYC